MIKKFIMALVLGVMCISVSQAAAPKKIVGATAFQMTDLPSGVCESGVFTMTSEGVFSTAEDTSVMTVGVGPAEDTNAGFLYITTGNTVAQTTQLYQVHVSSLTQSGGTLIINTAPNNPDRAVDVTANFYDTNSNRFTVVGSTTATSCNAGANVCLHVRQYSGLALAVDVITSVPLNNADAAPRYRIAFNSDETYYIPYKTPTAGQQVIGEFDSGFNLGLTGTITATSNFGQGAGEDVGFVYVTQNIGPSIIRYVKSNIAAAPITFSPGFAGGNSLQPLTVDEEDGWIYQPSRGTGATSNFVYRVATATMTISNTLTLGVAALMGKVLVDDVNDKLYVVVNSGATTNQIVRLNRTTFANEATFNGISSAGGVLAEQAQIDIPHQSIFVPVLGSGGGTVAKVEKVGLCS